MIFLTLKSAHGNLQAVVNQRCTIQNIFCSLFAVESSYNPHCKLLVLERNPYEGFASTAMSSDSHRML